MANPPTSHLPLHQGQQLPVAIVELSRKISSLYMDSLLPAERRNTFGMTTPLSLERSNFKMRALLSQKPEDEPSKHGLCSTRL